MSTLTPPRKPEPHECCGTGCIPCVMDIYEEELFDYEKALKLLGNADAPITATSPAVPVTKPANSALDPV